MDIDWQGYPCDGRYDELVAGPGQGREPVPDLLADLLALGPREGWEQLNALYLFASEGLQRGLTKDGSYPFLKRLLLARSCTASTPCWPSLESLPRNEAA